jgi:integrase
MPGSVVERPKGSGNWYVVFDLEKDGSTAKRRQKWHSGYRSKREAQRALTELLATRYAGTYIEPSKLSLGEYLVERWLPAVAASIRPTTLVGYRRHVMLYLVPRIGALTLQELGPDRITVLYRQLLESGGQKGRPLSANTVRRIHATLHRALRDAHSWGYVNRNAAAAAGKPRTPSLGERMQVWSGDEVAQFLAAVRDDRLYAAWHLAVATGMRRGEILGLRWQDVDLSLARVAVRQTLTNAGYEIVIGEPKTRRSRRSVALDQNTVAVLREWRVRQAEERLAAGPAWEDTGYVFTREDGRYVHPDTFSYWFERHLRRHKLRQIRFHDLRHTHASLALQAGVSAKVVCDRLGHSSVAFTLDVYSHVVPALQEDAAERVAALFRS